jgi:hypothetical protein
MQFHNPERQLVSLCEIQKTIQIKIQKTKNVMQLERQTETPALDVVGFLDFTCCPRFPRERLMMMIVCMAFLASVAFLARRSPNRGSFKLGSEYLGSA